jgi:hypothetical protein
MTLSRDQLRREAREEASENTRELIDLADSLRNEDNDS